MQELDYTKITNRMKQTRKELNLTQEQVANELNCTPAYISNVENNRVKLNLRLLSYYSKLCGVPIEYFLEQNLSSPSHPSNKIDDVNKEKAIDRELAELLCSFTISEKKKIIEILKICKSK